MKEVVVVVEIWRGGEGGGAVEEEYMLHLMDCRERLDPQLDTSIWVRLVG